MTEPRKFLFQTDPRRFMTLLRTEDPQVRFEETKANFNDLAQALRLNRSWSMRRSRLT